MASKTYHPRGYYTGGTASMKIKSPESVLVTDPLAKEERIVVLHPCGTSKPVVTVSNGPAQQQIVKADGIPVAIVANGNSLNASDIDVIECEAGGRVRF